MGELPQYTDVAQGALEDEWFLTALTLLTERKSITSKLTQAISMQDTFTQDIWTELWSSIIPPMFHVYAKKGLYVFRFMKEYKYRYVIVDGKLPCGQNKIPVFAQLQSPMALWVPLLEKAYAKLHGCYYSLNTGSVIESISDLIGYPINFITNKFLKTAESPPKELLDSIWLSISSKKDEILGCCIQGNDDLPKNIRGFLSEQIHSIIGTCEIPKETGKLRSRLIFIRKTLFNSEWNGKWSSKSPEYLTNKSQLIEKGANDNTLVICYKDWRELFTSWFNCGVSQNDGLFKGIRWEYYFTPDNCGGTPIGLTAQECISWAKNPFAKLEVKDEEAEFLIEITQEDPRLKEGSVYPFIGFIQPFCFTIMEMPPSGKLTLKT